MPSTFDRGRTVAVCFGEWLYQRLHDAGVRASERVRVGGHGHYGPLDQLGLHNADALAEPAGSRLDSPPADGRAPEEAAVPGVAYAVGERVAGQELELGPDVAVRRPVQTQGAAYGSPLDSVLPL